MFQFHKRVCWQGGDMRRVLWIFIGFIAVLVIAGLIYINIPDVGSPRFFKDQAYYYETLRTLSACPFGGADVSEVYATIKHIGSGREHEWHGAWEKTAGRIEGRAERLTDRVSKGLAFFRAHNYYRTAEFFLPPKDSKRPACYKKCIDTFYKGLECFEVKYEIMDVPYEGRFLKAVYYPGPPGAEEKPLIMASPGFDGIKEELYFRLVEAAHKRGYSVLTYEGPGQGAVLREYDLKFTPKWEKPVGAVLDAFLAAHGEPPRIILFGSSFGGYLAPRAAAYDDRIDGVIAYDVFYDFQEVFINRIPSSLRGLIKYFLDNDRDGLIGPMFKLGSRFDPGLKWGLANMRWTMGDYQPSELYRHLGAYSLKETAGKITADILILAGDNDHFVPLKQVEDFQRSLVSAKSVTTRVYSEETGGDQHCQQGATMLWHEDMFEWLKEKYPLK